MDYRLRSHVQFIADVSGLKLASLGIMLDYVGRVAVGLSVCVCGINRRSVDLFKLVSARHDGLQIVHL